MHNAFKASSVSFPDGIIWSAGSKKPYFPVSRNSTPYEYLIFSAPYVQSALLPLATSKIHKFKSWHGTLYTFLWYTFKNIFTKGATCGVGIAFPSGVLIHCDVPVAQHFVFCVVFCRSLFALIAIALPVPLRFMVSDYHF